MTTKLIKIENIYNKDKEIIKHKFSFSYKVYTSYSRSLFPTITKNLNKFFRKAGYFNNDWKRVDEGLENSFVSGENYIAVAYLVKK